MHLVDLKSHTSHPGNRDQGREHKIMLEYTKVWVVENRINQGMQARQMEDKGF